MYIDFEFLLSRHTELYWLQHKDCGRTLFATLEDQKVYAVAYRQLKNRLFEIRSQVNGQDRLQCLYDALKVHEDAVWEEKSVEGKRRKIISVYSRENTVEYQVI